jgi:putative two-component system response regulator
MLRKAAPMHDVGKIGIPDAVLKKPGSFTPDERAVMNRHAEIGAEILGRSRIALFQLAAEVAQTHHERWDGRGYPDRLAGDAIPLSGRIVAIVDCFDALTMDRCYRPAFSDAQALAMLREQRGRAFDPQLVDAFEAALPQMVTLRDAVNRVEPSFAELVDGVAALKPATGDRLSANAPRFLETA